MDEPVKPYSRPLHHALILAALLVGIDAFVLNQGVISLFFGLGLVFIGLPRSFLRKFAGIRAARLRNLSIYAAAVILVFVVNAANNRLARGRAESIVAAIKAFDSKYARYPESLNDLVPEFIERVPKAKYTLMYGDFAYFKSDEGAHLYYVAIPPFGRPMYDFARNQWTYLD